MASVSFPKKEEEILEYWEKEQVFQQTLDKPSPKGEFVFYEGPPTANGKPGIHHMLARAFKDLIPRYKTMQGYHVIRKGGWDTHGLPVELQVEKELHISGKPQIEEYGIAAFNQKSKESVWKYKGEWEKFTKRMGYWVDMDDPYVTYRNEYIESIWHIIKTVHDKDLLYKGHKVVPHCPRCGTALSSHEVAQGYKEVVDTSVFVKFKVNSEQAKIKSIASSDVPVYILSWTTTPWTLPGNVGLAVGKDIEYVLVKVIHADAAISDDGKYAMPDQAQEMLVVASELADKIFGEDAYEVVQKLKGKDLLGLEYEPLFPGAIPDATEQYDNAFKVFAADFVTTTDGTGVVHTAVMYGEDDYQLGEAVGLPKYHTVTTEGKFDFAAALNKSKDAAVLQQAHYDILQSLDGMPVKHKDKPTENKTTQLILDYLEHNHLLLASAQYKHDYPYCWRCDTPLLYYAKDSWFIAMSKLRDQLQKNNQSVNWVPSHIQSGRFGEWLDGVKDWALSRERYWGTPLPVWSNEDGSEIAVIGSRNELFAKATHDTRPTRILMVRHGQGTHNVNSISTAVLEGYPLTPQGEQDAKQYARWLSKESVDMIVASPLERTQQTANIIGTSLDVEVVTHDGLREQSTGAWEGKTRDERHADLYYKKYNEPWQQNDQAAFDTKFGKTGESFHEMQARTLSVFKEIAKEHKGKTVVVVAHQCNIVAMLQAFQELSVRATYALFKTNRTKPGAAPFEFFVDHDGNDFDLHRPVIDAVVLKGSKDQLLTRDSAVLDVWFDSGAMPYAQYHYPFADKALLDGEHALYPADYICEAIDQTRGWFYTLLAVATLQGRKAPYKNVICLSHINDKHGKKMSKSKGNIVDPWEMMEAYGADAVRMLFYTMNQPGETKNFDPRAVEEIVKKNWLILSNVYTFFELYAKSSDDLPDPKTSTHILDQWLYERTNQCVQVVTHHLDAFDPTTAGREIITFINELSTVYVQYSRDRFKRGGEAQAQAVAVLHYALATVVTVLAPFAPFFAEYLYQKMPQKQATSVHMLDWPAVPEVKEDVLQKVSELNLIIERVLALRAQAKIKVRQPLSELVIASDIPADLRDVIATRVNVKQVSQAKTLPQGEDWVVEKALAALNTVITTDLAREGIMREVVRHINSLRKAAKLTPDDVVSIAIVPGKEAVKDMMDAHTNDLMQVTAAKEIIATIHAKPDAETTVSIADEEVQISVRKVS